MATASISSIGIKRTQPLVKQLFRNAILHKPASGKELLVKGVPQTVLFLPWLGAKEKIAQKFINSWNNHGFSVLHITTTVPDLLMPYTLSEVTVKRMFEYLANINHNVIIHGISVGGYLGTRVVMESLNTELQPRITHQIFDSFTAIIGLQAGVQHAIPNPFLSTIASAIGRAYLTYADLTVIKNVEKFVKTTPASIPTYYMHSLADRVADYEHIKDWVQVQAKISPTSILLLPETKKIAHVNLFRHLGEKQYMSCIFKFLENNDFTVRTEFAINEETKELSTLETQLRPQRK